MSVYAQVGGAEPQTCGDLQTPRFCGEAHLTFLKSRDSRQTAVVTPLDTLQPARTTLIIMAPASLLDLVTALPSADTWGPPTTTETTLNGVPYAPYSKGDKLGRMADWTSEGRDRERGGRQQYNRNYRGKKETLCMGL